MLRYDPHDCSDTVRAQEVRVSTLVVVTGVVSAILAVSLAGYYFYAKHQRRLAAMSPEERELYDAEREHRRAVKRAELELFKANSSHKARVMWAERKFKQVLEQTQEQLGSYSGRDGKSVGLWADRVRVPLDGGSDRVIYKDHRFTDGPVEVTVDTAGNLAVTKQATLTRWMAYGSTGASLFKKTEMHDARELYLMIEGPDFASLVSCFPDNGPQVRGFAARIKTASKTAASELKKRERTVAQARSELEAVRNDRSGIDAATSKLEAARNDTARLDAARSRVNEASSAPIPSRAPVE